MSQLPRDETPSLRIDLPAMTFGDGHGAYWRLVHLTTHLKCAVTDGLCVTAAEDVSEQQVLTIILRSIQADLAKYAHDYPQTEMAELIRTGRYTEALETFFPQNEQPAVGMRLTESVTRENFRTPLPVLNLGDEGPGTGEESWATVVTARAVSILADSARHLDSSHRFSITHALIVLLLVCRRAGLSFLDPHANNISANYLQTLISRHLIKRPPWIRGTLVNQKRLYATWGDVHKAHMARINRARYRLDRRARYSAVYALNDTGEAYFVKKLLEADIQLTALDAHTTHLQAIGDVTEYPAVLRQPITMVAPDQLLEGAAAV